jgi:hypothetical protein
VKRAANKSRHVTRGNVLDDLGFSAEQAAELKFKAEIYQAILKTRRSIRKRSCRPSLESRSRV